MIESGKIPLRNGVAKLVSEAVAAGIPVAVCSTSNEKAVSKIVDLLGETAEKITIFAGDVVAKKKPDPAIYEIVEAECGIAPAGLLFADDRLENIAVAQARGWATHLFDGPAGWAERLIGEGLLTRDEAA